ncbi:hypothetical protein GCM10027599_29430 [Yimella radicis]
MIDFTYGVPATLLRLPDFTVDCEDGLLELLDPDDDADEPSGEDDGPDEDEGDEGDDGEPGPVVSLLQAVVPKPTIAIRMRLDRRAVLLRMAFPLVS